MRKGSIRQERQDICPSVFSNIITLDTRTHCPVCSHNRNNHDLSRSKRREKTYWYRHPRWRRKRQQQPPSWQLAGRRVCVSKSGLQTHGGNPIQHPAVRQGATFVNTAVPRSPEKPLTSNNTLRSSVERPISPTLSLPPCPA